MQIFSNREQERHYSTRYLCLGVVVFLLGCDCSASNSDAGSSDVTLLDVIDSSDDIELDQMIDDGVPDLTVSDGAVDAKPLHSYCEEHVTLLCDGFEQPRIAGWTREPIGGDGDHVGLAQDGAHSHQGGSSLKLVLSAAGVSRRISQTLPSTLRNQKVYMRAFIYLENNADNLSKIRWAFLRESAEPLEGIGVEIRNEGGGVFSNVSEPAFELEAARVERDRWSCWQMEADLSDEGMGTIKLTIDSNVLVDETGLSNQPVGGVSTVVLGIDSSAPGDYGSFWIDDLAIDTTPIPCEW